MKSIKIGETDHLLQKAEGSSKVQEAFQKGKMHVIFMRNVNFCSGQLQSKHEEQLRTICSEN